MILRNSKKKKKKRVVLFLSEPRFSESCFSFQKKDQKVFSPFNYERREELDAVAPRRSHELQEPDGPQPPIDERVPRRGLDLGELGWLGSRAAAAPAAGVDDALRERLALLRREEPGSGRRAGQREDPDREEHGQDALDDEAESFERERERERESFLFVGFELARFFSLSLFPSA